MIDYIKSDLLRYRGKITFLDFLICFFWNKAFNALFWMRICAHSKILKIFALPIHKWKQRGNIQIDYKTEIGYGLYIGHNGPVVINSTAKIGNNCNLSQGITIGSNTGNAAKIGDNVYIGPNVCIVENVTIGDNATIGAGSVVTKSIPKNATAAGNYAKVLNYNNPGSFINNKWK
ncbi:serine O-acetyltransferase [Leuconostoc lactis]|uniref:serine O-acetyltransferase n=1 Tax=Leuconostoc lactis TaxID=1246 RepID=UPI0028977F44|nr:DapH/DapD/GlmU-related protein [Leuconostoc lactis]